LLSVAARGKTAKPPAGTGAEQAGGASGAQADSRTGTAPEPPPQLQYVSTENLGPDGTPAVVAGIIPGTGNGGVAYFSGGVSSTGIQLENATLTANSQGELTAFNAGARSTIGQLEAGTVIDAGANVAAGNLHWGTWTNATITTGTSVVSGILTYIVGDVPTLPGAGVFTYNPVGGTRPTNSLGMTGSFLGGNVTVDFLARQLSVNNLQIGFNSATYTMNSGMQAFQASGIFGGSLSAACKGSTCGTSVSGNYAGSFVGANAPGMAMVYRALDSGVNGDIIGAQGFKR
jgi:hypothetical protein